MFVRFDKNSNFKSHSRTSIDASWIEKPRGPAAVSFQHTLWPRRRASESALLVSRAFAFVFNWFKVIIALSLCLSKGALQHTVHTSIIAAEIIWLKFFSSSNISVRTWGSLEQNQQYKFGQWKMQTADRVQNVDCRLQTGYKMQIENLYCFFRLIRGNMSSYNLPSVTQSLFRDHLSRLFSLLWNIPYPFLDHNRS